MKIACVQSHVVFGDPAANAGKAIERMESLRSQGVDLAVFPEAYLTGYCASNANEAACISLPFDPASGELQGPLADMADACKRLGMHVVVGFAAADGEAKLHNAAALIGPNGLIGSYTKSHLPELGYDKYVVAGSELNAFDTDLGKIGILICYDLRLPEPSRILALKGADIIVLPTNWPDGAQVSAEFFAITRAAENKVFLATCDRVGDEKGFHFIGLSKIIAPNGKVLAAAGADEETIVADIDPSEARNKRNTVIPGEYEMTVFESRRPDLYDLLTEPVKESARA